MDTERTAYRIESVTQDEYKTTLKLKEIPNGRNLQIVINNEMPVPFNPETGKYVDVICRIKEEDSKRFLSGYYLYPTFEATLNDTSLNNPLKEIFREKVFPLEKGDILIIQHLSLYSVIESVLK